jgi:LysR family glycine cleavage system transcriptional activator
MDRLPSFSGLTAFYAAARLGGLTAAATELNVTQPAVSRRIAALEEDLGCLLFDRSRKPVKMTFEGRELLRSLRQGFGQIEETVSMLRQRAQGRIVSISAPAGFVAFWLIPHLGELEDAFPEITIRIISQEYGERTRPGDIAIRFGLADEGDGAEHRLLSRSVYPVASPLYLQKRKMTETEYDLKGVTLLTMETARSQWHDWPSWFDAVDQPVPTGARQLDFSSYPMLVNAILAGQGVGLCWGGVLDTFLETGAVVRLAAPEALSERGYFARGRDGIAMSQDAETIFDWLLERASYD